MNWNDIKIQRRQFRRIKEGLGNIYAGLLGVGNN